MALRRIATFAGIIQMLMVLAGCGPAFTPALNKGDAIPAGTVLAVGKVVLEPAFETIGKRKVDDEPLEATLGLTFDLSREIKDGELYSASEALSPAVNETFFFPLSPGTRYIRSAQVMKVVGHHISGPSAGMPTYEVLRMYKNIKLDIPATAQVVYIGTIIYRHDGKRLVSISVRDEYDNAVRDLGKMKISGAKGAMVKKLALAVK